MRKRVLPKLDFNLQLLNFKRQKPQYKNLKYKKILSYLSKMDNSKSDIGLTFKNKIEEKNSGPLLKLTRLYKKDSRITIDTTIPA